MSIVPDSSSSGVILEPSAKPKQCSPCKNWCFTWSNYPSDWKEVIVPKFREKSIGYIIGEEVCPTTGTQHLQGYVQFRSKIRPFPGLALPQQIHWEPAKGNLQQNIVYCKKEKKFIDHGTCVEEQPYTLDLELYPWQENIVSILNEQQDDRSIYWFWEEQGCTGKTTFQKWVFLNYDDVVVLCGKASDMKNGILAFLEKTKRHPKIVLINIPRCQDTDHISWQGIEEIKDMFFYSPKYEGGMVCGPNPHVLIFSNQEPPMYKLSQDRWKVTNIS